MSTVASINRDPGVTTPSKLLCTLKVVAYLDVAISTLDLGRAGHRSEILRFGKQVSLRRCRYVA